MADEFDFPAVFTKNLPNGDVITAQDDTVIQVPFRPSSQSKATLAPKRKAAAKVTAPKRAVKKTAAVRNLILVGRRDLVPALNLLNSRRHATRCKRLKTKLKHLKILQMMRKEDSYI